MQQQPTATSLFWQRTVLWQQLFGSQPAAITPSNQPTSAVVSVVGWLGSLGNTPPAHTQQLKGHDQMLLDPSQAS